MGGQYFAMIIKVSRNVIRAPAVSGVARIWREGGGHGTDTWILDNELVLILACLQHKLQSRNE